MSLVVSSGCYRGSCGYFHRWRQALAAHVGIPLPIMKGYYDPRVLRYLERIDVSLASTHDNDIVFLARNLPLEWSALRPDPIHHLLRVSDTDGVILAADVQALRDRLAEVAAPIEPMPMHAHDLRETSMHKTLVEFLRGLDSAVDGGRALRFQS